MIIPVYRMKGFKRLDTIQVAGGFCPNIIHDLAGISWCPWCHGCFWNRETLSKGAKGCKRDWNIFSKEWRCIACQVIRYCSAKTQNNSQKWKYWTWLWRFVAGSIYPNPWLALHNFSIQDYLWPVGGARTYPVSTPPLADSHSLRTSATTCLC